MSEPVGIIYPPPELRGTVDSTAKFVAKNGEAFEQRIKREHGDKPKYSFLNHGDPYNAYYQHKVKEIRSHLLASFDSKPSQEQEQSRPSTQLTVEGDAPPEAQNRLEEPNPSSLAEHQQQQPLQSLGEENYNNSEGQYEDPQNDTSNGENGLDGAPRVRLKLNEYIQEMTMKLEEPPPLNYLATSAPTLTNMDCDIIRLTAQFIATHGRVFLLELVSREQNNSTFDFLKPQHGQFSYLTNLIMQYALIRNQPLDILEQLEQDSSSQKHVLDRIKMRAEWNRMIEMEQKKREEAEEKEKILYSQIDWHDFVVVETIDYQPDERGNYSPTTADQVGTRLLLQQRYEEQNVPEDMDVGSDSEDGDVAETERKSEFAVPDLLPPKPEKIVIRKDYDPKSTSKNSSQLDNCFVSPITNERIPVDEIGRHVKYNLANPRYLEKKDQMLEERRNEEAVFASGSQIQSSLKSLAECRTDIFGMNDKETDIGRRYGEDNEDQTPDDKVIWDGHRSSLKRKKLG